MYINFIVPISYTDLHSLFYSFLLVLWSRNYRSNNIELNKTVTEDK
jgi:hypothetical protein